MSYTFNTLATFEIYPQKLFTITMNNNDIVNEDSFIRKIFDSLENHLICDLTRLNIYQYENKDNICILPWLLEKNGKYYFSENEDVKYWKRFKYNYVRKIEDMKYLNFENYRSKTCNIS